jgi:peroxiredoxin Q/BCP
MLKINDNAPDFESVTHDGEKVKLSDLNSDYTVLYFYPKDMTPGCTIQAIAIKDNIDFFEKNNIKIFGISRDSSKSHNKFVETFGLNFPLIVDEKTEISQKYGVLKEKSMFGKKYMGFERTTFIIDNRSMKIIGVLEKVNPATHMDDLKKLFEKM